MSLALSSVFFSGCSCVFLCLSPVVSFFIRGLFPVCFPVFFSIDVVPSCVFGVFVPVFLRRIEGIRVREDSVFLLNVSLKEPVKHLM